MRCGTESRRMLASYTRGKKISMSFVLDDSEAAVPMFSDVCAYCKHWIRKPGRQCEAFPQGIPLAIWLGENDHHLPYTGDHGIQFAPTANFVPVQEPSFSVKAKRAKARKRRFLLRPYLQREAELRVRLWQDPQIRERVTELLKSASTAEAKQVPSVEVRWLGSTTYKAKTQKRK